MGTWCVVLFLTVSLCLAYGDALGVTWQDLLDRADSLVAAGDLDSAGVVLDEAVSNALTKHAKSDTTVELRVHKDGARGKYYFRSYAEAESLYARMLSMREKILGSMHPDVAETMTDLASVYDQQSKYTVARPLYERALAIREETLGPEHQHVAQSLNSLANLYSDQGKLTEAEPLYRRALAIWKKTLGPDHPSVAISFHNLGNLLFRQAKYEEAEPLYQQALAIREKALGSEHPDVAQSLESLAHIHQKRGEYNEADSLYRRVLDVEEKTLGPTDPEVATTLMALGGVYVGLGRFQEAIPLQKRALAILENALGPEHVNVAICLINIASVCRQGERPDEAEPLLKRALTIAEGALGREHALIATIVDNLIHLYMEQSRYAEAEPLLKRSRAVKEVVLGPGHPEMAGSLNNLAVFHDERGKYREAEPLYLQALAIWEKALGPEHPHVAITLINLANLYRQQGRYAQAEPLYRRGLAIWENVLGPEHPDLAVALSNFANLYYDQGKYDEAESLNKRALAIREQAFGVQHPSVAISLFNLAGLCMDQREYAEAERMYEQALAIWRNVFGPEHKNVAESLANLADLCEEQARYGEADSLYGQALAVWEKVIGPGHPNSTKALSGQATLCRNQGRYAEAELLYGQVLDILEEALGQEHHSVARCLEAICGLYRLQNDPSQATGLAKRACDIRQNNFLDNVIVLSERDALVYSQFLRNSLNEYLTSCLKLASSDSGAAQQAADVVLSRKGLVSDGMFERQKKLVEEADSTTLNLAESLRFTKFQLSKLFVRGPNEDVASYQADVDSLSKLANELEVDLSRHSASFRRKEDYKDISTTRIASLLPENSALVEYVRYDYLQLEPEEKIPHYMVLVVKEAAEPVIVELGAADEIDAVIKQYRDLMLRVSSAGREPTIAGKQHYERIIRDLYSRIWKPIGKHVTGKDLVLIAPDGALNMISFAGLIDSEGKYLIEEFPIHYLSSGRDVIRLKDKDEPGQGLFALGDPDYDVLVSTPGPGVAAAEGTILESARYVTRNVRSGCGDLKDITVKRLPATRGEIEAVSRRWQSYTDEPLAAYVGSDATEERFKSEAPRKRVVHLATHGYFLEGVCQPRQPKTGPESDVGFVGENPLLLSGLFFAGANLHGEGADSLGTEDGILTAYEVSAMDLSGTEMVVLSACETGLGRVQEGEGVYGLRRAFQMAGARTVVSALWPVPDEVTADMMSQLYERQDGSIPETLRRIQLEKINELRQSGQPDHPYTWAGFIAMGDWR